VRDKPEASSELSRLFAQYGVEPFLESTSLLVALLEKDGELISWNPAFDSLKQTLPDGTRLKDFLAPSSAALFEELLVNAIRGRARILGNLWFAHEDRSGGFVSLFVPLPGRRVLFIAEPVSAATDLEAVTAELQHTKQVLMRRETEIKAVIAQAHEVSHTDALTFLPNRLQIIGDLQREVMFSDRYGTPLTISLLDVDHFKRINDTHGHIVGDEVLRKLADGLRQHIRHPDTIGRYGGEEFLIVLPHSTLKAATEQAHRLCEWVRSFSIMVGGQTLSVTVSIGVAQYRIHKEDWQALLNRSDRALYQAKDNGRDRWAVAEE